MAMLLGVLEVLSMQGHDAKNQEHYEQAGQREQAAHCDRTELLPLAALLQSQTLSAAL